MYGKNPIAKHRDIQQGFLVKDIWYTIQGEGPLSGLPAVFLRLGGCNLRCAWCDTEFETGLKEYTVDDLAAELESFCMENQCLRVVITGGEPLLQELGYIITHPALAGVQFQIETAGTVWPDSMIHVMTNHKPEVLIVVSPKTPALNSRLLKHNIAAYKYIIRAQETDPVDGLPVKSTQHPTHPGRIARPLNRKDRTNIYVQPCDEGDDYLQTQANTRHTVEVAMKHGYRISLQLHKMLDMP